MAVQTEEGPWLIAHLLPCSLFALKVSTATSSVGRTLLIPTPYAIKLALVEAAFAAGLPRAECDSLLRGLTRVEVRVSPPERAVVTHTFLKIRQEPKIADPEHPYISSVAYREFVYHRGEWRWAFALGSHPAELRARVVNLLPFVRYIGKRGSFVQFGGLEWRDALDASFTQPLDGGAVRMPPRSHVALLDDLGPEADLASLSPYSPKRALAGRHRVYVNTLVPIGVTNAGPGFTEYRAD